MVTLHFCTSDSWGGLEVYAGTLILELQRSGVQTLAVCSSGSPLHQFLRDKGIGVFTLPDKKKFSFRSLAAVRTIIREHAVDVVHVHFHKDIWLASTAMRNDDSKRLFLGIYMGVGRKRDILHRWVYKRVDGVITSSKALNALLPELYPVAPQRIFYIPYGRYTEQYRSDEAGRRAIRAHWNIPLDAPVAGTMVRIDPGKGVLDFLQSFLYLDNELQQRIHYLVVGEPTRKSAADGGISPYESRSERYFIELQSFIREHHLEDRIHCTGYQSDLISYLGALDIFVFPSRDEMYSLAVLDAMAMRLPVIAARSGGNLLQIRDGENGTLYTIGDGKDLARAVSEYVAQPALRRMHGEAGRKFVEEEHAMPRVIDNLVRLYRG